jgi:hypothetical protein
MAALSMNDVTRILSAIEDGDARAPEQLLPLVYDELRKLAVHRLARESPGQTLQATVLVHEAYLRLIGSETTSCNSRPRSETEGRRGQKGLEHLDAMITARRG